MTRKAKLEVVDLHAYTDEQLAAELRAANNTLIRGSVGSRKGQRQMYRWVASLEWELERRQAARP